MAGPDWRVETRTQLRRFAGWWLGRHRRAARSLRTAGRRAAGVRQALSCLLIDLFLLLLLASAVALVVSPIVRS